MRADLVGLPSMGWIYNAAASVIVVLDGSIWEIIQSVSTAVSPRSLTHEELVIIEEDTWISRVWTYQELVNAREVFFTTGEPSEEAHAIEAHRFLNCVGFSLMKRSEFLDEGYGVVLQTFHNVNTLEDTLADRQTAGYLERTSLGVFSNMAHRNFDPQYPQNRLLACMGALTMEVSWGPPSTTTVELAEKLMLISEANGDYSFIYTSDQRNNLPGLSWRPNSVQSKALNLVPVVSWHTWGTQNGRNDGSHVWLHDMAPLVLTDLIDIETEKFLDDFLYGSKDLRDPEKLLGGMFRRRGDEDLKVTMLRFLRMTGFTGSEAPQACKTGYFFSQLRLEGRESVELFAANNLRWAFGSPGLARWKVNGQLMYCAGVFTGTSRKELAKDILLE